MRNLGQLGKQIGFSSCLLSCVMLAACQQESTSNTDTTAVDDGTTTTTDGSTVSTATTTLFDGSSVSTTALVALGEQLYNDTNLSTPAGQSCASCHDLFTGFDDPDSGSPTSQGADGASIGSRNAPTASYAAHIPDSQIVVRNGRGGGRAVLIGGQFWDGRAATLEDQAKQPFLNPVEMANADEAEVISKVSAASYSSEFETVFGAGVFDNVGNSFNYVADAIAAFERSETFSPFTSKFDQVQAGTAVFTTAEQRGQAIFNGRGQCNTCHRTNNGGEEVFSDFEFRNIGVPSNPTLLAALGDPNFVDNGLGTVTDNTNDNGKFRTPNLRNIAITAPYMHNGVFTTLEEVINFYNRRDLDGVVAEVPQNVDNGGNIGELGLSANDISDLIAFLETLTDQ